MIIALIFLLVSVYFGFQVCKRFELFNSFARRISFAFLIGFSLQSTAVLAVSWILGSLSEPAILFTALVFALAGVSLGKWGAKPQAKIPPEPALLKSDFIAIAFSVLFIILNLFATIHVTPTGFESTIGTWGDYPLHLAIANSFAQRDNFPPAYPILVGEPLKYSFGFDFASAILMKGGFDYRAAFLLPNILVFFALAFAFASLVELLAGGLSREKVFAITLVAFALFFLNGNYGVAQALQDSIAKQSLSPLLSPSMNYSNLDSQAVVVMNYFYSILLPARSALLGLALSALIYLLLYSSVIEGKWRKKELFLAGVLAGLLPLAHAHSLVAVGFVAAFLIACNRRREWAYFIIPAAVIALPQILFFLGKTGLFKVQVGWMAPEKTAAGFIEFWAKNGWATLLCFIAWILFALKSRDQKKLVFAAPFVLLFIAANLIVFQPWEWDNSKLFMQFFLFASIGAAFFLESLYSHADKLRKPLVSKFSKSVVGVILILAIASGVLTVFWMLWGENARYETFSNEDFALAVWVDANTPKNALFASSQQHQNPVASLAGRQIMAGYEGWLWSHGLNFEQKLDDAKQAYFKADCNVMRKYGVGFVLVRSFESEEANLYLNNGNFERVYEDLRGNIVFKSKCST